MKISKEERDYLEKILSISPKVDISVVRDILRSILMEISIQVLCGNTDEIYIPFLGKLSVDIKDRILKAGKEGVKTEVKLKLEPSKVLEEELIAIYRGEEPPSTKYIKKLIDFKLYDIIKTDK